MGAKSTKGEPLESWVRTDWPAAVLFSFVATLASCVWPALVRVCRSPERNVKFCPKTVGADARRAAAAKSLIV